MFHLSYIQVVFVSPWSQPLRKACLFSVADALRCAERIGFPVMLKASEGGGGKGIRKSSSKERVLCVFQGVFGVPLDGEFSGSCSMLMFRVFFFGGGVMFHPCSIHVPSIRWGVDIGS